jgi:hypothetical protein
MSCGISVTSFYAVQVFEAKKKIISKIALEMLSCNEFFIGNYTRVFDAIQNAQ